VKEKECFIISPLNKQAGRIVKHVITPAVTEKGYVANTLQQLNEPGDELVTWVEHLLEADLVVANLEDNDPRVHYGVAVRHTTSKPVILVVPGNSPVPDYMAVMSAVSVDTTDPQSVDDAKAKIKHQIEVFESEPAKALANPVVRVFADRERVKFEETTIKLQKKVTELETVFDQLRQIADSTRKPLKGIAEILVACFDILRRAPKNSRVWIVGMTLGLGPPHRYRNRPNREALGSIEADLKRVRPDLPAFDKFLENLHDSLMEVVENSPESHIVCLDQAMLSKVFLERLARRPSYHLLADDIADVSAEIKKAHEAIEKRSSSEVRYLTSLPLQLLIVESADWAPSGVRPRAALVFHVGSENVASALMEDGELGFYTEIDSVVTMFANLAESLYQKADN